jgi:predicted dehydrogenase
VQARLTFDSGCVADLSANRVSPQVRRDMQIWSAEGCAHLDFAAREAVLYLPSPTLRYGTPPLERAREPGVNLEQLRNEVFGTYIKVHRPTVALRDQLTEELIAFTHSVRTREAPLVGGLQAARAMAVAERILDQVAEFAGEPAGRTITPFLKIPEPRKLAG